MRLSTRQAQLLLLLAPSIAIATSAPADQGANVAQLDKLQPRYDRASEVAPVDGNDGRPHNGPWIETDGKIDETLPPLDGQPDDPTIVNGKRIPDSNDGVMDDPNRQPPKEGTRGTEGGVSEKEKARLESEASGRRTEKTPETPKEAPAHHADHPAQDGGAGHEIHIHDEAAGIEVRSWRTP
jgi:hypothetical protein